MDSPRRLGDRSERRPFAARIAFERIKDKKLLKHNLDHSPVYGKLSFLTIEEIENRIDHLWIRVRDLEPSRRFYETVAPAVGLRVHDGSANRFHVTSGERSFALVREDPVTENVHLAFPARDRASVEEFHRAALAAGFRDNGAPGERPEYHAGYYGAYVLDPDGNNVEAVFHDRGVGR